MALKLSLSVLYGLLPCTTLKDWFCLTEVESVYCAVRNESLYKTEKFVCKRLISRLTEPLSSNISFTVGTRLRSEIQRSRSEIAARGRRFFTSPSRSDRHRGLPSLLYYGFRVGKAARAWSWPPPFSGEIKNVWRQGRRLGPRSRHRGLPNFQNKIYCSFFGTVFRSSVRESSSLYPVTRPGNYLAVGYSVPRFSRARVATGFLHCYAVPHMLVWRGLQLRAETTSRLLLPSSLARAFRPSACQRITTLVSVYHLHWTSNPCERRTCAI